MAISSTWRFSSPAFSRFTLITPARHPIVRSGPTRQASSQIAMMALLAFFLPRQRSASRIPSSSAAVRKAIP